jgi:DNA-binding transcriptional ArsR family regulator
MVLDVKPRSQQRVFTGLAEIAQALGRAHRLELVESLGQGERSDEDLGARTALTVTNTSRHLQLLRRALLVEGRRERKRVFYRYRAKTRLSGCCTPSVGSASGTAPRSPASWRATRELGFTVDAVRALLKLSENDGQGVRVDVRELTESRLADDLSLKPLTNASPHRRSSSVCWNGRLRVTGGRCLAERQLCIELVSRILPWRTTAYGA